MLIDSSTHPAPSSLNHDENGHATLTLSHQVAGRVILGWLPEDMPMASCCCATVFVAQVDHDTNTSYQVRPALHDQFSTFLVRVHKFLLVHCFGCLLNHICKKGVMSVRRAG